MKQKKTLFSIDKRNFIIQKAFADEPKVRVESYDSLTVDFAKEIAIKNNCYKLMLMTGSRKETTLNFYRNAGYTDKTKTAFDQRV